MAGLVQSAMQQSVATTPQAAPQAAGAISTSPAGAPSAQYSNGAEKPGSTLKDSTLNQIETGVEKAIQPQYQQMYESNMVAAMDLAFNPKTHAQMVNGLKSNPDPYKSIPLVVAGMMGVIYEQAKPDPNVFLPSAIPASINLMCQLLNFAEQSGLTQIDPKKVADCTDATSQAVLRKFGIDGSKVRAAVSGDAGAAPGNPPNGQPVPPTATPQPTTGA